MAVPVSHIHAESTFATVGVELYKVATPMQSSRTVPCVRSCMHSTCIISSMHACHAYSFQSCVTPICLTLLCLMKVLWREIVTHGLSC